MEVANMNSTTSSTVVGSMRSWFTCSGIPLLLISEMAPQFVSENFNIFAYTWGFTHTTSSPLFPQSNSAAEREVQTAKQLLCKSSDPYLTLLAYRSTPLSNGLSTAELLNGRKQLLTIPTLPSPRNDTQTVRRNRRHLTLDQPETSVMFPTNFGIHVPSLHDLTVSTPTKTSINYNTHKNANFLLLQDYLHSVAN
uniref:Integrase catalytic domain-containing protein n=1 Tax=Salmo trutta TaxID=8032 RepID=A0A674EYH1_SALTR